jgi:type IV pilus assembly protein PilA
MYTGQMDKAKNAIVKANAATVHTIIQGNLADTTFATAVAAVNSIKLAGGTYPTTGSATNADLPAGMKNPHDTAAAGVVVKSIAAADDVNIADGDGDKGMVIVKATATANRFYIVGFDQDGNVLQEQYTAQK